MSATTALVPSSEHLEPRSFTAAGDNRVANMSVVSPVLRVDLTFDAAPGICRLVRTLVRQGARAIRLDLSSVHRVDTVGLAALFQATSFAARMGVACTVIPSPRVRRALLDGHLLEDVALDSAPAAPMRDHALSDEGPTRARPLAMTDRMVLRMPRARDLEHFERWAHDPLLTQMVGSELLYRCRHLRATHPEAAAAILDSTDALTVLVAPREHPDAVAGFLRLYDIRLASGFGFLETAIADPHACRRGWGVEASRLLLAYAMDVLELHRVEAKVFRFNVLSLNALRRNGFREEGVLREAHVFDGRRWDLLVFALLHEEMAAQRAAREQFPYMGFWPTP